MIFSRKSTAYVVYSQISVFELLEPITHHIGYSDKHGKCVNWSYKDVYKDYSHYYQVLTYTDYADSIDNFIAKYPTVTIQTSGYAYSDETIGDVGSGKFGSLTFQTTDFKHTDYFERFMVKTYDDAFWWNIEIMIGIGFKHEENKFYIRPFIDGWIYSGGAVMRCNNYALNVDYITFNPEWRNRILFQRIYYEYG